MSIVWIDMHIRDERFLERLKRSATPDGEVKISADTLAAEFLCHPNTARAILKRLERANYIEVGSRTFRGGFTYKVKT